MDQDQLKAEVARYAADYIDRYLRSDSIIGVGTGSTANYFIDALAKMKHKFDGAVSSSEKTAERLRACGIPVYDLNSVNALEVYVDGADEANDALQLIKGAGGALTREKIVASVARLFVCIVDESKNRIHPRPVPAAGRSDPHGTIKRCQKTRRSGRTTGLS